MCKVREQLSDDAVLGLDDVQFGDCQRIEHCSNSGVFKID
jgi:hypothetical protein